MKIKSKLMVALLLVALVPIVIGAVFSYYSSRKALTSSFVNHLKSVSSIQHARIHTIVERNLERLSLVSSRTQLRISLARIIKNGTPQDHEKLDRILTDALSSIEDFIGITLYSPEGVAVASSQPSRVGSSHFDYAFLERCRKEQAVDYFSRDQDGNLRLSLSGPLFLDQKLVGVIVIESRIDNILELVRDYSGLGESGETLVVKRNSDGAPVFLLPTRFGGDAAVGTALAKDKNYAAHSAFADEKVLMDSIDYREHPVLAIARQIEATDWGVVVKIDKDEAYGSVNALRRISIGMAVLAGVVILVVATFVAAGLSAPINQLAVAAERIAAGDLTHKAEVVSRDEVGTLAVSFNQMVESLLQSSAALEKKVVELQAEIVAHEQSEQEKAQLILELRKALAEIKTLKGIMPICASCKKIRDDQGFWSQIEAYISSHSEAEFSHGLCPDCAKALYPDVDFPEEMI